MTTTKVIGVTTPAVGPYAQSLLPTASVVGGTPGSVVLTNQAGVLDPSLYVGIQPFTYVQSTPSTTWTIVHGLHTYPSVTVTDSAGNWVIGGIQFNSLNQVTLTFSAPFSGTAVLI